MTSSAGKCGVKVIRPRNAEHKWWDLNITFSTKLMERDTPEGQYNTAAHEFAHAIEFVLRGDSDHGAEFRMIHRAMGGNGARCHQIENRDLKATRIRWRILVNGREYRVTTQKKNKLAKARSFNPVTGQFKPFIDKVLAKQYIDGYGNISKEEVYA